MLPSQRRFAFSFANTISLYFLCFLVLFVGVYFARVFLGSFPGFERFKRFFLVLLSGFLAFEDDHEAHRGGGRPFLAEDGG